MTNSIGVAPCGHDSSVAQIDFSTKSIFAESFERWTRVKHDSRFPRELLIDRLEDVGAASLVVQSEGRSGRDLRHFDTLVSWAPISKALRKKSISEKIWFGFRNRGAVWAAVRYLRHRSIEGRVKDTEGFIRSCSARLGRSDLNYVFTDHHTSHAASAYYFAPVAFKNNSVVVTLDGQGDGSFCKIFRVADNELIEEVSSQPPASIPLLFSIATAALGFVPSSDEGKLEALAAYGNPRIDNPIYNLLANCFSVSDSLEIVFEGSEEFPFSDIATQFSIIQSFFEGLMRVHSAETVAAGVQLFYEDFFSIYLRLVRANFDARNLCVAGGGFANVKLNQRIFEENIFESMFIFPAMGDDGAALGALVLEESKYQKDLEWLRSVEMPFWGSQFTSEEVRSVLLANEKTIDFEYLGDSYHDTLAGDLSKGRICAHFRGKMEFGPRALGNRSILANPMSASIRDDLNLKFKKREWFQPFCPSILEEEATRLFDHFYLNRHMTCAFTMRQEFWAALPGIVHVDGTSRAQFVNSSNNHDLYRTLVIFKRLTGFGALINTSFNIHGRSIVRTPQDAVDDFLDCNIVVLFIEVFRVTRGGL